MTGLRNLVLVLGDQLDAESAAIDGFDPARDRIWMAEVAGEARHVWSHKARIALFLAAMRHHAETLRARHWPVDYLRLDEHPFERLAEALAASLAHYRPERVVCVEPGEWRVLAMLQDSCAAADTPLELRTDRHFMLEREEFASWARGRTQLRMEHFYRWMRKRSGILMEGGQPVGGTWNFDKENRANFKRSGPDPLPAPRSFAPDRITVEVLELVERRFPGHPGQLAAFDWPVTEAQAQAALTDFIEHRLPLFGRYQDAMWQGEPWLYHARISAALNLKLLTPQSAIAAAENALREGLAPLASVEGFIRQVLGWREFIRGVYWRDMPGLASANHFSHHRALPQWFWTGETPMNCLRDTIGQTLKFGYAHHIQRLMITGNFALLAGIEPRQVADWYLAVYVDAVEWVEHPNVLGMALFANGGRFTSKPYVASGAYVKRMSNYCANCRFSPAKRHGPDACPFTTLYWNFIDRHRQTLLANPRTTLMARNLDRLDEAERQAIRAHAAVLMNTLEP